MKDIKVVGVVGAGTMGSGLAQKFAQEGFEVVLADREMKYVHSGISGIETILAEGVKRRLFRDEQVKEIIGRIKGTAALDDLKSCDLIIEAIFENFQAKTDLFNTVQSHCKGSISN